MNVLDHFSVPYRGMGNGIHQLKFSVDSEFFKTFEDSHIDNGKFEVDVELDKRHDHSVLLFDIKGKTVTNCDRCLSSIDLPISGSYKLLLKYGEDEGSNDEIMFIHPETSVLNLAQIIYEYILLSMPLIKVYECEEEKIPPCNFEVLNKLNDVENEESSNPSNVWDSLKGLDFS